MGFSRQKRWSGLPFPFPEDLPDLGFEPLQADSLLSEPGGKPSSRPFIISTRPLSPLPTAVVSALGVRGARDVGGKKRAVWASSS